MLKGVTEAEAALAAAQAIATPLPPRADLEALAADLPRLWNASTTSSKDRKRLLRTVVADVTLISAPSCDDVRVGIRWRSGATDEVLVRRPAPASLTRRTPTGAIDFVRWHRDMDDEALVIELNAGGFKTGTGRSFDVAAVRWLRFAYRIVSPSLPPLASGELTVADVAARLGITESAVYYWVAEGQIDARHDRRGRWCVPFSADVEDTCRQRVLTSAHIKLRTQTCTVGGAV